MMKMIDALKKRLAEKANNIVEIVKLPDNLRNERYDICKACEFLKADFCKKCGCFMPIKTYMPGQRCPLKKW